MDNIDDANGTRMDSLDTEMFSVLSHDICDPHWISIYAEHIQVLCMSVSREMSKGWEN